MLYLDSCDVTFLADDLRIKNKKSQKIKNLFKYIFFLNNSLIGAIKSNWGKVKLKKKRQFGA